MSGQPDDAELLAHREGLAWAVEREGWDARRKLAAAQGVVAVGQRVKAAAGANTGPAGRRQGRIYRVRRQ